MRDGRNIFNRLDHKASLLQGSNCTLPTTAGTVDFNVNFPHAKFHGLFGGLLSGHLTSERRAFSAALKVAGSARRPT